MSAVQGSTIYYGVSARLIFQSKEDEKAVLDLMRRFSSAMRYAYNRLLEGVSAKDLERKGGPLNKIFGLNNLYSRGAILKAQTILKRNEALGIDSKKMIFGSREVFEKLKKRHLNGKRRLELKRKWKESRQGNLYSRGASGKERKGNLNLMLIPENGTLWLRINLGNSTFVKAIVKTSHPNLNKLLERVYSHRFYNVELTLKDGKIYAEFSWSEQPTKIIHSRQNGALGVDINADPYNVSLALVSPDGNLKEYLTISLEILEKAKNKGEKDTVLWNIAHRIVEIAEKHSVAIAIEKLKNLHKLYRRGDGFGRKFRGKISKFAYKSLLNKVHRVAQKRGVEVIEVIPAYTSIIGALKYAPLLSISKDVSAALVIGRRALGFKEKFPKEYKKLFNNEEFLKYLENFYKELIFKTEKQKEKERNPYIKGKISRYLAKLKNSLKLILSLSGSSESQEAVTNGRNATGANLWGVAKVGFFLPLLGQQLPRDLSPLKPILFGSWERWKGSLGPDLCAGPDLGYKSLNVEDRGKLTLRF